MLIPEDDRRTVGDLRGDRPYVIGIPGAGDHRPDPRVVPTQHPERRTADPMTEATPQDMHVDGTTPAPGQGGQRPPRRGRAADPAKDMHVDGAQPKDMHVDGVKPKDMHVDGATPKDMHVDGGVDL